MLSSNICTYTKFVTTVMNNKVNYTTVELVEKKKIIANFA